MIVLCKYNLGTKTLVITECHMIRRKDELMQTNLDEHFHSRVLEV